MLAPASRAARHWVSACWLMELVDVAQFFNAARFFRVIPGAIAQFGANADPGVTEQWWDSTFPDDIPTQATKDPEKH